MTKFSGQLFDDLMREHGSTLANAMPSAAPKRHSARRTLLAAGTGCAAAGAVAGALVAGGSPPTQPTR